MLKIQRIHFYTNLFKVDGETKFSLLILIIFDTSFLVESSHRGMLSKERASTVFLVLRSGPGGLLVPIFKRRYYDATSDLTCHLLHLKWTL